MQSIDSNFTALEEDKFGEAKLADFKKISKIGSGTYGIVYQVAHKKTNEVCALKEMRLEVFKYPSTTSHLDRERGRARL